MGQGVAVHWHRAAGLCGDGQLRVDLGGGRR